VYEIVYDAFGRAADARQRTDIELLPVEDQQLLPSKALLDAERSPDW
jgi:hypothetical protein